MEPWIPAYDKLGFVAGRTGSRLEGSTPNNLYPTGDGSFIHITAMANNLFRRLAAAMGQPELASDPRFAEAAARNRNFAKLDDIIGRWTQSRSLDDLEAALSEAAVPATRIFTIADIFRDPHYRARKAIIDVPDQHLGSVAMAAVVPRLSATPGDVRHSGHDIGHDTREVFTDILGFDDERIGTLARDAVIVCAPSEGGRRTEARVVAN